MIEEWTNNIKIYLFDGKIDMISALKSVLGSSGETKDKLIKTGEMTPFGTVVNQQHNTENTDVQVIKKTTYIRFFL